jgi:hypothetical protein
LSDKKSTGFDDIPSEILKNLDEKTGENLFEIIKKCYEEDSIPKYFIKSKTITLPKKGNATDCSNYRTIAILSHSSKIIMNIIKNRLKYKVEERLDKDQLGFRKGKGMREVIIALRQLLERRVDVNRTTYSIHRPGKSI